MKIIFSISFLLILFSTKQILSSNRWPKHDISTLKLLQIVHRHGDRSPTEFTKNDPFANESYWPQGFGQLTSEGKYRMYKLGQFIRQEYQQYLGDGYSPRELYIRSSIVDRCIESVSCLLAGAYPPKPSAQQWNIKSDADLGRLWQPFPIQTFMPKENDLILEQSKECPLLEKELAKIYNRTELKNFMAEQKVLYENLTKISGSPIHDIKTASSLYSAMKIELDHSLFWTFAWTHEIQLKIAEQLHKDFLMKYKYNWDSPIIKRLRNGGLVRELNKNFQSVLDNKNNKKLYLYSTHDTEVAGLLHAMNIFNGQPPPFGSALLFELHETMDSTAKNTGQYFVRVYYHNETVIDSGVPYLQQLSDCNNQYDCPIDQYLNSTKHLLYENFDKECNLI